MRKSDTALVRVVGLGAYRRRHHEETAVVLETHSRRGQPLRLWRVLWQGREVEMDPALLEPVGVRNEPG